MIPKSRDQTRLISRSTDARVIVTPAFGYGS